MACELTPILGRITGRLAGVESSPEVTAQPLTRKHVERVRGMLERWCQIDGYDLTQIAEGELWRIAEWVARYGYSQTGAVLPPRRGLMLYGPAGRGKTRLLRIIARQFGLSVYTADEIDEMATNPDSGGSCRIGIVEDRRTFVLDDLGAESLRKYYGNAPEFPQVLVRLYERWQSCGKLVLASSNLNFAPSGYKAIVDRYGQRVADRILEMFDFALLGGKNWRLR